MNPTLPEEAGQTARSFLDVMREQPALLGMIVANIALLVFMFYALNSAAQYRETLTKQVLDNAASIHTILSQRSVTCPDYKVQSDESKPLELLPLPPPRP
jgi:hypothetical protein